MSLETLNRVCSMFTNSFWISTYNLTQALIVKLKFPRWSIPQSLSDTSSLHHHHHHHHRGHHQDSHRVADARVGYHLEKGWSQRRIRSSGRPPSSLGSRYEQLLARNSHEQRLLFLKQLFPTPLLLWTARCLCLSCLSCLCLSCTQAHCWVLHILLGQLNEKSPTNCNALMCLIKMCPGYNCVLLIYFGAFLAVFKRFEQRSKCFWSCLAFHFWSCLGVGHSNFHFRQLQSRKSIKFKSAKYE